MGFYHIFQSFSIFDVILCLYLHQDRPKTRNWSNQQAWEMWVGTCLCLSILSKASMILSRIKDLNTKQRKRKERKKQNSRDYICISFKVKGGYKKDASWFGPPAIPGLSVDEPPCAFFSLSSIHFIWIMKICNHYHSDWLLIPIRTPQQQKKKFSFV